jgi:hypothetical protein
MEAKEIEPKVGMTLHGICGGIFGRSFHGDARIEFVAFDYFIARDNSNGVPMMAVAFKEGEQIMIEENWLEKGEW